MALNNFAGATSDDAKAPYKQHSCKNDHSFAASDITELDPVDMALLKQRPAA